MLLLFLCLSVSFVTGARQKSKPNIVFIMADDLGWNDVGWHSSDGIQMPNIDRLLRHHSVLLNNSYVAQLCSPTRSAFLTGYYPYRLGTQHGVFMGLEPSGVPAKFTFFPQILQGAGYHTALVGKWHLGYCNSSYIPTSRGFDRFYGYYLGSQDYFNHSRNDVDVPGVEGLDFWNQEMAVWSKNGTYSSEIFSQQAMQLIDKSVESQKPLFLYLAFQSVHFPLEVPEKYKTHCHQNRRERRIYCGMVKAMDDAVGQVVARLKKQGMYENTIIIFSNDNGGQIKDGGNNYPLFGRMFSIVDWFPTILTASGKPTERYGDGVNQWDSILSGGRIAKRRTLVYNIFKRGSAIRFSTSQYIIQMQHVFANMDSVRTS